MSVRRILLAVRTLTGVFSFMFIVWAETAAADNSRFYGIFDMRISGTEPHPWTEDGSLRIGTDQGRMREECYLHIPAEGNPVTNVWTDENGASVSQVITISGDTIALDYREDCLDVTGGWFLCYTKKQEFGFTEGHNGAAISGSIWSQDPEEKQGLVTGSLTRVEDEHDDSGGGCFIGAAIARCL
jgi:hypothetical protein